MTSTRKKLDGLDSGESKARPAKRQIAPDMADTIPIIGFEVIDASACPDVYVDYTLVEHALFQPGYPLHHANICFSSYHGALKICSHIRSLVH